MNISRPGSRMARALRNCSANAGVSGEAGPSQTAERPTRSRGLVAGTSQQSEPPVACEICNREFRTKRGRGVHMVSAHPVEANDRVNVERVKARWPEEEVRLMARAEATATSAGILFINQYLLEKFPSRTLEAIKGKRRQEAYREMVRAFRQQVVTNIRTHDDADERAGEMMTRVAGPAIETSNETPPPASQLNRTGTERLRGVLEGLVEQCGRLRSYEARSLQTVARDFLAGQIDVHAIERWLGSIFPMPGVLTPRLAKSKRSRNHPATQRENTKQRRKREFALVQSLYKKNLKTCLSHILDGGKRERPSAVEFRDFWRPVMEQSGVEEGDMSALRERYVSREQGACTSRSTTPTARGIHLEGLGDGATARSSPAVDKTSLWDPITSREVERIFVKTGTAPGLDGIEPRAWNAVPTPLRVLLFNLLLLAGEAPSSITTTRTIFLEKGKMPDRPTPADYRPLSIGSVVLRHFHKILAKRLTALDIIDQRQRGFRPVDGVCENVTVLSAVLDDARKRCRTLHLACVDLSKAFDTVSHKAIHRTLEEVGLPLAFREYVQAVYKDAKTVFQPTVGNEVSMIQLGRGVRQGDPLSPLLFNLVVDRALGVLSEDVGYRIGSRTINALGYADDIVLLSSTRAGLQENLNRLNDTFLQSGLSINATKTGVLSLVASGRDKKVKIDTTRTFTVGGMRIPQKSPIEVWTYLGTTFQGAREYANDPPIPQAIEKLSKAPLKPQQRLRMLRDCLLPRYYHRWTVGSVTSKCLRRVDVQARTAVRRWLRLPHDVPVGYFHAPIQNGGIGLPLLRTLIPILKHNRLRKLCVSSMPAACAAAETTYVARQMVWCDNQMRVGTVRVTTTAELRRQCSAMLHRSCDGSGLREVVSSKLSSYWISAGADQVPGADYVHYHHVRANCLPSRTRTSRGRSGADVRCRAGCPERETPAHCVQRCGRTHGGRILRHNDLCRQVGGFLKQKGWQVDAELAYETTAGRRRPDLTIARGGEAVVVDAQVVSSETALNVAHERKVEKYRSNDDLVDRVADHTGVRRENVRFSALTISWRGVWSPDSEREMKRLGLTTGQLRKLTTRVLWGSWMNWRRFNEITTRFGNRRMAGGAVGARDRA